MGTESQIRSSATQVVDTAQGMGGEEQGKRGVVTVVFFGDEDATHVTDGIKSKRFLSNVSESRLSKSKIIVVSHSYDSREKFL